MHDIYFFSPMQQFASQKYTKEDVLSLMTREDLRYLGIRYVSDILLKNIKKKKFQKQLQIKILAVYFLYKSIK